MASTHCPEYALLLEHPTGLASQYPELFHPDEDHYPPYLKSSYFALSRLNALGIPITSSDLSSLIDMLPPAATKEQLICQFDPLGLTREHYEHLSARCQMVEDPDAVIYSLQGNTRFVLSENKRALASANALKEGDMATFFLLQYQTGGGLREEYGIGNPDAEAMVSALKKTPFVQSARILGPGDAANISVWVRESDQEQLSAWVMGYIDKHLPDYPDNLSRALLPITSGKGASIIHY